MSAFTETQVEALAELTRAWRDRAFTVIGASALNHHIRMDWRKTDDLDLLVAVDLEDLPAAIAPLSGWRREPRLEHRWWSPRGLKVDIIPAGPGLLKKGTLVWPESGDEMNLVGLDLAFDHADLATLPDGTAVRVARLAVIVALKMVSWLDRRGDRERDLADIAYVLEEFLDPCDERRYEDHVLGLGIDYDAAGPYVLGRELAAMVGPAHRALVEKFLSVVGDRDDSPYSRMLRLGPTRWRNDPDNDEELAKRLDALRLGLNSP